MELPKPTGQRFEKKLLRPSDVGEKPRTIIILSIGPVDQSYSAYSNLQLEVEMEGLDYTLPIHTDKSIYMDLYDRFGGDPENWKGQKAKIRSQFSKKLQEDFIEIVREVSPKNSRKG